MMVDIFTPHVCVLVEGFHNINQTEVIIMIGDIMDSVENEVGELHCDPIGVFLLERVHWL